MLIGLLYGVMCQSARPSIGAGVSVSIRCLGFEHTNSRIEEYALVAITVFMFKKIYFIECILLKVPDSRNFEAEPAALRQCRIYFDHP
jgi:hypothetical protein